MSLKGYQWLKGDKVIMYFTFKYRELVLMQDVSQKDFNEFKSYIKNNINFDVLKVIYNDFKILE